MTKEKKQFNFAFLHIFVDDFVFHKLQGDIQFIIYILNNRHFPKELNLLQALLTSSIFLNLLKKKMFLSDICQFVMEK